MTCCARNNVSLSIFFAVVRWLNYGSTNKPADVHYRIHVSSTRLNISLTYVISLQQSAFLGIFSGVTGKLDMLVIIEINHKIVVFLQLQRRGL